MSPIWDCWNNFSVPRFVNGRLSLVGALQIEGAGDRRLEALPASRATWCNEEVVSHVWPLKFKSSTSIKIT